MAAMMAPSMAAAPMGAAEDNMEAEEEEELLAHAQQQPMPLTRIEGIDGLKSKDIRILMDAGYHTVESVARATLKDLQLVNGISEQKADKLKAAGTTYCLQETLALHLVSRKSSYSRPT